MEIKVSGDLQFPRKQQRKKVLQIPRGSCRPFICGIIDPFYRS